MLSCSADSVIRVAHGAGNNLLALRQAIDARVDWIEVDIWYSRGRLIAGHARPLDPLPLVCENWRLYRAPRPGLTLPDLLRLVPVGIRLLLDLKGHSEGLSAALVQTFREHDAVRRCFICGQNWKILDAAARLAPDLRVVHSFGSARHILTMRRRPVDAAPILAAAVAHELLQPELLQEFKERGIAVLAWTVNSDERARKLVTLGISGIISDRLELLASLLPARMTKMGSGGAERCVGSLNGSRDVVTVMGQRDEQRLELRRREQHALRQHRGMKSCKAGSV